LLEALNSLKLIALCVSTVKFNLYVGFIDHIPQLVSAISQESFDRIPFLCTDGILDNECLSLLQVEVTLGEAHLVDQTGCDELMLLQLFKDPLEQIFLLCLRHLLQGTFLAELTRLVLHRK
jgi:hypothetical protein